MRLEKEFVEFLTYDMEQDYFYGIERTHRFSGKNGIYYDIFLKNTEDYDKEDLDMIIIERFFNFLDKKGVYYNVEEDFYNINEYVNVYDIKEYVGDNNEESNR